MRYCTLDDLLLKIPAKTLAQLTNDAPPFTEPNAAVVDSAVADAEEIINGHLRSRYELPLKEVPTVVRNIAVSLARHELYARRPEGKDDLPPAVVRSYKASMEMLASIQKGSMTILVQTTQAAQPEPGKMRVKRSGAQIFPRETLDKY